MNKTYHTLKLKVRQQIDTDFKLTDRLLKMTDYLKWQTTQND